MSYNPIIWHSVQFLNEQSQVTLLTNNPVELAQLPDRLHGSTLKSQSVLLSLFAIPLSASTAKTGNSNFSQVRSAIQPSASMLKLSIVKEVSRFPSTGKQKIQHLWTVELRKQCSRLSLEQYITGGNASCELCAPTQAASMRLRHFVKHLPGTTHPQSKSAASHLPAAFVMTPYGRRRARLDSPSEANSDRSQTSKVRIFFSPDSVCLFGSRSASGELT